MHGRDYGRYSRAVFSEEFELFKTLIFFCSFPFHSFFLLSFFSLCLRCRHSFLRIRGVIPALDPHPFYKPRFPRIRGGDPPQSAYHEPQCPFSPHARGGDCDGTKHPPLYPFFPRMRGARCTRPRDASRCRREELYANGDVTSYIHGRGTSRGRSDASAYTADSKRWILQALC